jgi:predicted DNA-binding transcriptional regulator AlpA
MAVSLNENYLMNRMVLADYNDLLSVDDLSSIFEVSKQTIYKEMKDGKFGTPIQIGRAYKVPKIYILQRYFHGR